MIAKFFRKNENTISAVLAAIEKADDLQINQIIRAVIRRYSLVFPDWEVFFLSLPKDPGQRRAQLESMLEHLKEGRTL